MCYGSWIVVVLLMFGAPSVARAQSADTHTMAVEQFRRGRELVAKRNFKQALKFFRTSQSLEPHRVKLLNIAICEKEVGQLASALRHFQEVASQFPAPDKRLKTAKDEIQALTPRVPRLRIHLAASAPEGTVVKLDDLPIEASSLDTWIPIDPGDHVVTVIAAGAPDNRYTVTTEAGKSSEVSVAPDARTESAGGRARSDDIARAPGTRAEPVVPSAAASVPAPSSGRRLAGFVVGGIGVGSIGVGAVIGVLALVKHAELENECPSHVGCSKQVADEGKQGKVLSIASTAAFAVGLTSVAVGTFLVLWPARPSAQATVTVTAMPGGGGLGLAGRF